MLVTEADWVYESPDGGKTVYRRRPGSDIRSRELHYIDPEHKKAMDEIINRAEWNEILSNAKSNPALQKAIDRVKLLYALTKDDNSIPWHPV